MWQFDFHLFYSSAQAILQGNSPYIVTDYLGPYPLALLFIPLTFLPEPVAYFVYTAINLGLLWKVAGLRQSLWAVLSFPVLFSLFVGQVDLILALLAITASPWALGVIFIAKPQVAFITLPWFLYRLPRKDYWKAILPAALLLAISFALSPTWVTDWLAASRGMLAYANHASNIYWLIPNSFLELRAVLIIAGALGVLVASYWMKDRKISWVVLNLFAPLSNIYSTSVLAEWIGPFEALLSWLAIFIVGGKIHTGAPLFLINLAILGRPWLAKSWNKRNLKGLEDL
jgi:hypothetical protein